MAPKPVVSLGKGVVAFCCAWELVALATNKVPTISSAVQLHRSELPVKAALFVTAVWLAYHLGIELHESQRSLLR